MNDDALSDLLGIGAAALAAAVVFVQGHAVAGVACVLLAALSLAKVVSPGVRRWTDRNGTAFTALWLAIGLVAVVEIFA